MNPNLPPRVVEVESFGGWFFVLPAPITVPCTRAITELGFVRVEVQAGRQWDVPAARKASGAIPFVRIVAAVGAVLLPEFAKTPAQLTDGHLLARPRASHTPLATLDGGVPGTPRSCRGFGNKPSEVGWDSGANPKQSTSIANDRFHQLHRLGFFLHSRTGHFLPTERYFIPAQNGRAVVPSSEARKAASGPQG